jgi:hypothetical protein
MVAAMIAVIGVLVVVLRLLAGIMLTGIVVLMFLRFRVPFILGSLL